MKKLLFITSVLISALLFGSATESFAQNEHLKFAGIPLDGTITQFHQKLIAKGYTIDKDANSKDNVRRYKGTFAGEQCDIAIFFDEHTKIVYRAKVLISELSEEIAEQKYSSMKSRLIKKYDESSSLHTTGERDGLETFSIIPMREKYNEYLTRWKNSYGEIDIYRAKNADNFNYPYHFYLHIDYADQISSDAHEKNVEDDL